MIILIKFKLIFNLWWYCLIAPRGTNMSAKNNSESEYYGRDLVMWCNVTKVCNMSAKNNSDSEYYGRDFVTQNKNNITFVMLFLLIKNKFSNRPK